MLTNHLLEINQKIEFKNVWFIHIQNILMYLKNERFFFSKWVDLVSNLTRIEKKIKVRDFSKLRCYAAIEVTSNHRFLR